MTEWTQKCPSRPGLYWVVDEHHTVQLDLVHLYFEYDEPWLRRFGHTSERPTYGCYYLPVTLPIDLPVEGTPEEALIYEVSDVY